MPDPKTDDEKHSSDDEKKPAKEKPAHHSVTLNRRSLDGRHGRRNSTSSLTRPKKRSQSPPPRSHSPGLMKSVDKLQDDINELIHIDAHALMVNFREAYENVRKKHTKPTVLITGITGSGKSSLVNSIFGTTLAETGAGKPITQHFLRYTMEDKHVVIYDSKGLEIGSDLDFVEETNKFFEEHQLTGEDPVHVIWYIINAAGARFHPFEERLCREVFTRTPIAFIINKADISSDEARRSLRDCIKDMALPNCIGIYDTIASAGKTTILKPFSLCPKCGSDDVLIHSKKKLGICEDCNYHRNLKVDTGLERVIGATIRALPQVAREAFVSAQRVSFMYKDKRARMIVREFFDEYKDVHLSTTAIKTVAKMLTRLSILWEFREHGHMYGSQIAKDIVGSYSFRDKLFLFLHKNKHHHYEMTALGILWNRCVRNLAKYLFHECYEENHTEDEVESHWNEVLNFSFNDLNSELVAAMETRLESEGIDALLEHEMPMDRTSTFSTITAPSSPADSPPRTGSPTPGSNGHAEADSHK
eukprot:TRINITY_DN7355_c0_g1_i1.p1 TRINITY_DN7355_c0_g1~~TRINITY_DN7355_c0_g1_i1.p1  ORF type:complete len:531 (-),score=131.47 TRINITY_DN7355_c0_g1_i1:140-1732(-)